MDRGTCGSESTEVEEFATGVGLVSSSSESDSFPAACSCLRTSSFRKVVTGVAAGVSTSIMGSVAPSITTGLTSEVYEATESDDPRLGVPVEAGDAAYGDAFTALAMAQSKIWMRSSEAADPRWLRLSVDFASAEG